MRFIVLKRGILIKSIIAGVLVAAVLLAVGMTDSAKVFSGTSSRKMPICSVDVGDEKVVSLSFDAGWGAEQTAAILEALAKHDAKATYFVTGAWAQTHGEVLKSLSGSGRVEIGSHSNTHPHMVKLSQKQTALEISASVATIESAAEKKVELFRTPYGEYSDAVIDTVKRAGLYPIRYDVDSLDGQETSSADITAKVLSGVKNGSIVLLHNDGKHTVAALPAIVEGLKNKGYRLITVGEMIHRDGYTVGGNGKQIKRG